MKSKFTQREDCLFNFTKKNECAFARYHVTQCNESHNGMYSSKGRRKKKHEARQI